MDGNDPAQGAPPGPETPGFPLLGRPPWWVWAVLGLLALLVALLLVRLPSPGPRPLEPVSVPSMDMTRGGDGG